MHFLTANNININYQFNDFGKQKVLIFSHSLGSDFTMWDSQVEKLGKFFNILRYDTRGHGSSTINEKPHSIADLGNDVLELMNALKIERAHFCGLSMGGLVGQWLGINASERLESIILANTAAKIGTLEGWNERINLVQNEGFENLSIVTPARWFTPNFINENHDIVNKIMTLFLQNNNRNGYCANVEAIREADFRKSINKINVPTLVISGAFDPVTTVADGDFLKNNIPFSKHITLEAAHLSNVEQDEAFSKAILMHIEMIN